MYELYGDTLVVTRDPTRVAHNAVIACCTASICERGAFAICLSGGTTPKALYRRLSSAPQRLDWSRVSAFLGDERAVPADHPDSNWGMIERELLSRLPVRPDAYRPAAESDDLDAAAADYAELMETVLPLSAEGVPVFDLVLLGLGEEGHIASLFPDTAALAVGDRWYVANSVPELATVRLTITYPVIEVARQVLVLVSGRAKALALAWTLHDQDESFPAAALARMPNVRWVADDEAARAL